MTHKTYHYLTRVDAEEAYLTTLHGKAPVCNYKQFRLDCGFSLRDLSTLSYLSKNALVRAEQGTYTNGLPALSEFWARRLGASVVDIQNEYEDYQYYQRKRHLHYFGVNLQHQYDTSEAIHPFRQLRKNRPSYADHQPLPVGPDEVSRALCLPVDTLRYWEKKFRQQQTVPKPVTSVMLFIGYTQSEVQQFCRDYEVWRKANLKVTVYD